MIDYNPHLNEGVLSDRVKLPAGYVIRVPKGAGKKFADAENIGSKNVDTIAEDRHSR
jgi:hypothetical protein